MCAVVCGPSGVGKSALAAELAARVNDTVWWFSWRGPESFVLDLSDKLGMLRQDAIAPWPTLVARKPWLLVVDGVDRPGEIVPLIEVLCGAVWKRDGLLVLITGRAAKDSAWGDRAHMITLGPLRTAAAAKMLRDRAPGKGNRALAARIGGFPLNLHLAGRALANHDAGTAEPWGTVGRSLDLLAEEGLPLTRPLLRMLSLTANAPLPTSLITPELLVPAAGVVSAEAIDDALTGLDRYGLVSLTIEPIPCVAMPEMVREICADEPDSELWQETLDQIVLGDAEAAADSGRAGWDQLDLLAPHLVPIARRNTESYETLDRAAIAVRDSGYGSQVALRRAVLEAELATFGPDNTNLIVRRHNLATALLAVGDYWQAAGLLEQTVVDFERVYGPDHFETLNSLNAHAQTLDKLGEHRRAVELHERILAGRGRALGHEHYQTMVSRNDLGVALHNLGEDERAVSVLRQAHAEFADVFGPDHRDTLNVQANLATALHHLGDYRQAAEIHEHVLADRQRLMGVDHFETRLSRVLLANSLAAIEAKWGPT